MRQRFDHREPKENRVPVDSRHHKSPGIRFEFSVCSKNGFKDWRKGREQEGVGRGAKESRRVVIDGETR